MLFNVLVVRPGAEDVIVFMGIMKVFISFVKYLPQVFLNFKRKRTDGWSLENVMLDLGGGVLSFIQIFIDWKDSGETKQFTGGLNVAKFLLAIVCIGFDLVFLFQHYVLYPRNKIVDPNKLIHPGENDAHLVEDSSPRNFVKQ